MTIVTGMNIAARLHLLWNLRLGNLVEEAGDDGFGGHAFGLGLKIGRNALADLDRHAADVLARLTLCRMLAERGVAAFVLKYRLCREKESAGWPGRGFGRPGRVRQEVISVSAALVTSCNFITRTSLANWWLPSSPLSPVFGGEE